MKRKILFGIFGFFLLLTSGGSAWSDDERYPIMKPDRATLCKWIESYENAHRAFIDEKLMERIPFEGSVDLRSHLQYTPNERQQGTCGNCWIWAGTGVMEIALDVQEGIKDRLSVQYVNSCFTTEDGYACCGGWLENVVTIYTGADITIPWSNTNAHFQDASTTCFAGSSIVSCDSIATSPSYPVTSITDTTITTQGVSQSTAVANIKNVLAQNKAIWFGLFLATQSDWDNFYDFWDNDSESDIWNPDFSCGHTWVEGEGGGHAVLVVGYNDDYQENSYWIVLNSWGTASGNRPNGLFRLDMNMNYSCTFYDSEYYYSFYWQTLDIEFDGGPSTTTTAGPTTSTTTVPVTTTTTTIAPEDMSNLVPCKLYGWSYPIVPSSQQGTHTYDPESDVLKPSPQKTYIDFALCNENNGDTTDSFTVALYIDEVEVFTEEVVDGIESKSSRSWLDEQFSLSEGEHTLRLVVDVNNDIDEADENDNIFEMSFTWESEQWPDLYSEMLGVDYQEEIHLLRNFRDEVLVTTKTGKTYVDLLYKNSSEIASLLLANENLRVHTASVIEQLLPELALLLNDEEAVISFQMITAIEKLLNKFEVKASPNVKTAIRKLKKEIGKGEILDRLGIGIINSCL